MRPILALVEPEDTLGLRIVAALQALSASVRVLTPRQLSMACMWEHAVSSDGKVRTTLRLGPETFEDEGIGAVLNRLPGLRTWWMRPWAAAADHEYADAEFSAFVVSWLASLPCTVLHPPGPGSLDQQRGPLHWLVLAGEAGLPTRATTLVSDARDGAARGRRRHDPRAPALELSAVDQRACARSPAWLAEAISEECDAFVVADRAFGAPDPGLATGLAALAARTGEPFLRGHFGWNGERWLFDGAFAFPDAAPVDVVQAVADHLAAAAREPS